MMRRGDVEAIQDAVMGLLSERLTEVHGGRGIVTNYVVLAEVMDENGERWMHKVTAPGSTSWSVKGILHEALFEDPGEPVEDD